MTEPTPNEVLDAIVRMVQDTDESYSLRVVEIQVVDLVQSGRWFLRALTGAEAIDRKLHVPYWVAPGDLTPYRQILVNREDWSRLVENELGDAEPAPIGYIHGIPVVGL